MSRIRTDLSERQGDRSLQSTRVRVAVLAAARVVSLLLAATGPATFGDVLAGGGKLVFLGGLAVVLVLRARCAAAHRWAWGCFAVATAAWLAGGVLTDVLPGPAAVHPSWSDLGYTAFYPAVCAGPPLMLRSRGRRIGAAAWLDALVTGVTAAALAADAALGALLRSARGGAAAVAAGVAYPVADLLLLVLVAGALAVIGRNAGPVWWWLTAGLGVFVVTDTGYAAEVVAGTYRAGGVLDLGWGIGFRCVGLAASSRQPGTPVASPAAVAPSSSPGAAPRRRCARC